MEELIILGLVPGTSFDITFGMWLVLVLAIVVKFAINIANRVHFFEVMIIALAVTRQIHRVRA